MQHGQLLTPPHVAAVDPDAPWALDRGATALPDGAGVRFAVWAPRASRVVARVYHDGGSTDHPLELVGGGLFAATVADAAAGADYHFVLDGAQPLPDPVSRWQPADVHGPSRVVDPAAFAWTDAAWRGPAMADYVIYELHVGAFSAEGTFEGAIPHLAGLVELGVTAIELMPVAEFPGSRNWGYDGVFPYAPECGYGGPDGLKRLVDAAHAAGLAVVLDVVYNHLGPEGNYLDAYGPYFTDTYHTPWGRAVNFDGPGSDEVRRFVIDNALHWVTEYHVDALRVDAVHGIFDSGATHVLAELTGRVHARGEQLGRPVLVIAESDLNDPKVVRAVEEYGWGFDAQWSDDFHHAVHVTLTGETSGYYADYVGDGRLAAALRDAFVYAGSYSPHPGRRHGGSPAGLSRDRFVVAIQNHDQVGNRAAGDRLAALVPLERQALAAALLLLTAYVPLMFMGEEYGETNPFPYFVSHGDPQLVEAVREGRRREFAAFGWGDRVPDPQDAETFLHAKLDRAKLAEPRHAALYALYRDLLALRRQEPALRPGGADVTVEELDPPGVVRVTLSPLGEGATLTALFNVSGAARVVRMGATPGARGRVLLRTSAPRYGGPDAVAASEPELPSGDDAAIDLSPHSAVLLSSDPTHRPPATARRS